MNNLNKIILIIVVAVAFGTLIRIQGNMWIVWQRTIIAALAFGVLISWLISYLIPIRSILIVVLGLVAFVAGIILAIRANYSYTYWQVWNASTTVLVHEITNTVFFRAACVVYSLTWRNYFWPSV